MKDFELFNQGRTEYFRGQFEKREWNASTHWEIICISAGGTHKSLDVMDLQHKHKTKLVAKLKGYAKKFGFKIRCLDGRYQKSE